MKDGGSAFPQLFESKPTQLELARAIAYGGMSLRQWYAGMALQGLLANPDVKPHFKAEVVTEERAAAIDKSYARIAFRLADALLAEEEKP